LKSKRIIVKECIYGNVKFYDWTDYLQFMKIKQR
jgi:hypothetical protein